MKCPRCDQPLEAGTYHEVEIDKCPGCQGLLVSNKVLTPLLEAMTRDLVGSIDPDLPLDPLKDKGPGLRCPRCEGEMEHHGYMETKLVFVDTCDSCFVLWLDSDELAVMSQLFAKTTRRSTIRQAERDQQMREMERRFDATLAARSVQRRLLRGFIRRIF